MQKRNQISALVSPNIKRSQYSSLPKEEQCRVFVEAVLGAKRALAFANKKQATAAAASSAAASSALFDADTVTSLEKAAIHTLVCGLKNKPDKDPHAVEFVSSSAALGVVASYKACRKFFILLKRLPTNSTIDTINIDFTFRGREKKTRRILDMTERITFNRHSNLTSGCLYTIKARRCDDGTEPRFIKDTGKCSEVVESEEHILVSIHALSYRKYYNLFREEEVPCKGENKYIYKVSYTTTNSSVEYPVTIPEPHDRFIMKSKPHGLKEIMSEEVEKFAASTRYYNNIVPLRSSMD